MIATPWQRWLRRWLGRGPAPRSRGRVNYRPRVEPLERRELLSFTAVSFPTSAASSVVVTGDFNHDGKLDLALLHPGDGTSAGSVGILLGNGNGTFQAEHTYTAGVGPTDLIAGDFNGDGNLDLALTNTAWNHPGDVAILLGNGDGTFRAGQTFAVGLGPASLAAGDFNGDGKLDLVVANSAGTSPGFPSYGNTISLLLGNGNGTFQSQQTFLTGKGPVGVAVGDFTGDGKLDVAVANTGANSVSVLLGNGNGTFAGQKTFAAGIQPEHLAAADFTGDGKLDLVVGGEPGALLLGNGDGTFAGQQPLVIGRRFAVGDLTDDGKPDLVMADEAWFNTGGGTFRQLDHLVSSTIQAGQIIGALPQGYFTSNAIGDFNGDGNPDVVLGNALDFANHNFVILFNHPDSPHFLVTVAGGEPHFPGDHLSVTVTALDAHGNVETNYSGVVTLSSTDPAAVLPPAYTFTAADQGTHTFSVTLNTAPHQTITATDALGAMAGSASGIQIRGTGGYVGPPVEDPAPAPGGSSGTALAETNGGFAAEPHLVAVGAAPGGSPEVQVFDADTNTLKYSFLAYGAGFTGGVRVAFDDHRELLITAPGPGGGPDIHVYNALTGALVGQFWAFDPRFTGGCYIATGDVNNDGTKDIVVGADAGGGPQVRVFSGKDFSVLTSFFAFDPRFTGGVRVATSGSNLGAPGGRNGASDIICGAGPGGGSDVAVYNGSGTLLDSFLAFDPHFTGGVYVAANDAGINNEPYIAVGAGAGGGPDVAVFSVKPGVADLTAADVALVNNYLVAAASFTGGVPVAFMQPPNVGLIAPPDLVIGPSVSGGQVELLQPLSGATIDSFMAQDQGGMYVAASPMS